MTVDFIKDITKHLNAKQQTYSVQELDQMIINGMELLKFMEKRSELILEKDVDGVAMDDFDFAIYDLPKEEFKHGNNFLFVIYLR